MGGGEAEGGKVDAGGKAQEAVVGTGQVVGGVVVGGNGSADLESIALAPPRPVPSVPSSPWPLSPHQLSPKSSALMEMDSQWCQELVPLSPVPLIPPNAESQIMVYPTQHKNSRIIMAPPAGCHFGNEHRRLPNHVLWSRPWVHLQVSTIWPTVTSWSMCCWHNSRPWIQHHTWPPRHEQRSTWHTHCIITCRCLQWLSPK